MFKTSFFLILNYICLSFNLSLEWETIPDFPGKHEEIRQSNL